MENTVRLNDQEIIHIAWAAVRAFFPEHVLASSHIEVRHSVVGYPDVAGQDEDNTASIWFVHEDSSEEFDPRDIVRANIRLWDMMKEHGDPRFVSLYHGFRSNPRATRRAA